MTAITQFFAAAVRRFPWAVLIASVILAGILSSLASQVVIATGNEGFAPDNAEIAALDRISELFGTNRRPSSRWSLGTRAAMSFLRLD